MRLIDADALRQAMYHETFEVDSDKQKWDSGCWIRYKMFENAIENAPTIEAEPVKHGRWIEMPYSFTCSVCGVIRAKGTTGKYNYCPKCGAKMENEDEIDRR